MTKRIFGFLAIAMTLAPAAFAAPLQNGNFQDSSPPLDGWTTTGNASLATGAGTVKALRLHETCAPGLSRAFQTFDIPANAAALSFRYRLTSPITPDDGNCPGLTETSAIPLPPDAFLAFLIDPNGDRIIPHDPNFTEALLYHEAGSAAVVDSAYVTIEPPDSDGLRRVILNLSGLMGASVTGARVEFGLASARNDRITSVIVDDVAVGCPAGYCCDGNELHVLDDGSACTADTCDAMTGLPVHTTVNSNCCPECMTPMNADVIIMFDQTGSVSQQNWVDQKAAARAFIVALSTLPEPRPYIGMGRFAVGTEGTMIGEDLTNAYGFLTGPFSPVAPDFNDGDFFPLPGGSTALDHAIFVAHAELNASTHSPTKQFIILITDGHTNANIHCEPSEYCVCPEARAVAIGSKTAAEASGIAIAVIHFVPGSQDCDSNEIADTVAWLRDELASSPDLYFETDNTALGLECAFMNMLSAMHCDDGDPTTTDICDQGRCYHGPAEQ